jgi:hypothetical protein
VNVRTLAVVANVLSMARRLTRAQAGTIYSCEADGLRFLLTQNDTLAESLGHAGSADLLDRPPLAWTERSVATYVGRAQTTLNIPDAYDIPASAPYAFNPRVDRLTGFRTVSMLVVPLHAPIDGILQLINATNNAGQIVPFSREAQSMVEDLAFGRDATASAMSAAARD